MVYDENPPATPDLEKQQLFKDPSSFWWVWHVLYRVQRPYRYLKCQKEAEAPKIRELRLFRSNRPITHDDIGGINSYAGLTTDINADRESAFLKYFNENDCHSIGVVHLSLAWRHEGVQGWPKPLDLGEDCNKSTFEGCCGEMFDAGDQASNELAWRPASGEV